MGKRILEPGLLPCPFCGSAQLRIEPIPDKRKGSVPWHQILHLNWVGCGVSFLGTNKKALLERWNTRKWGHTTSDESPVPTMPEIPTR